MKTLRSIFRRKVRASLTILGIIIGVFALIAMGAMAEKLTILVDGGSEYYKDKAIVAEGNILTSISSEPMSIDRLKEIEEVDGVTVAQAEIGLLLDEEMGAISMGPPAQISGTDLRGKEHESFKVTFADGRDLKLGERNKVVVGADLVTRLDAEVGKNITIRDKKFEVVGIMEKTLTAPDTAVVISLYDAQRLYHKSLPNMIRDQLDPDDLATSITAFVGDGYDPDKVAKTIEKEVKGLTAFGPKAFKEQIGNAVGVFTSIITLIGLIALLVGGLSVVNTMSMSIAERTREIGIRKAIGASEGAIIRQFLAESALIGLIGGLIGLGLGWGFTSLANAAGNASGTALFLVTPRLAIGAVSFALILGVIGGFFPSWRAARLNPVSALRYE